MNGVLKAERWLRTDTIRRRVMYCNDGTTELRENVAPPSQLEPVWHTVAAGVGLDDAGTRLSANDFLPTGEKGGHMSEITREEAKQAITEWLSEHVALRAAVIGRVSGDKYEATLRLALAALEDAERDREDARRYRQLRDWPGLSVSLERDAHTVNRETAAQEIEWSPEAFHETPEQLQAMRDANTIWRLQWYPNTPIGFNALNRATLDELIDRAAIDRARGA